jgi:hypothetical protein
LLLASLQGEVDFHLEHPSSSRLHAVIQFKKDGTFHIQVIGRVIVPLCTAFTCSGSSLIVPASYIALVHPSAVIQFKKDGTFHIQVIVQVPAPSLV